MEAARCRNCAAFINGRYCADCGQAADVHLPSTHELLHEVVEGLTHSDSRLWRTLKSLWFKPGTLTLEFIAGRRAAFLPPFRLYLVMSVVFFLAASFSHTKGNIVRFDDAGLRDKTPAQVCHSDEVLLSPTWDQRLRSGCEAVVRDRGENLLHVAISTMPKAMFIFLPAIAFFHMLLYWRPRHRYVEQLLFFIHLHAFFFSAMTLVVLASDLEAMWPRVNYVTNAINLLLLWSLPVYTLLAMHRVFRRSWVATSIKALALFCVYFVALSLTVGAVFAYAFLQLE